jgi:type IV pilus assembly protein PilC
MPATYYYRARTPEGSRLDGSIVAESPDAVVAHLRSRALFVTTVTAAHSIEGRVAAIGGFGPPSRLAVVAFFRALATMVAAGVSLHRALSVTIAQCVDARLAEALRAVRSDVESGMPLAGAMRRHPKAFAELYVATIDAGESGGVLDEVLDRLATLAEKDRAFRKKVGGALTYPLIVLAAALALTLFLIATIVPTFGRMFAELGVPLPVPTRALLTLGSLLASRRAWAVAGACIVCAVVLAVVFGHDRKATDALDRLRLRMPFLGVVLRKAVLARLSRMLGSLLRCGVDLLRAVDVVAPVSGNAAYAEALRALGSSLREGDSVAATLSRSPLFDPLVVQMVRVGEETGALDAMLLRVADHYEADVEVAIATLSATLEPLLIGGVGIVVGAIVFAIFVPLYTMIGQIR